MPTNKNNVFSIPVYCENDIIGSADIEIHLALVPISAETQILGIHVHEEFKSAQNKYRVYYLLWSISTFLPEVITCGCPCQELHKVYYKTFLKIDNAMKIVFYDFKKHV